MSYPANRLGDMVLDELAAKQLARIIKEQRLLARIKAHGLSPRRNLLLVGANTLERRLGRSGVGRNRP